MRAGSHESELAASKTLAILLEREGYGEPCDVTSLSLRGGFNKWLSLSRSLSPCVLVQPDGWARGERKGYGEPRAT